MLGTTSGQTKEADSHSINRDENSFSSNAQQSTMTKHNQNESAISVSSSRSSIKTLEQKEGGGGATSAREQGQTKKNSIEQDKGRQSDLHRRDMAKDGEEGKETCLEQELQNAEMQGKEIGRAEALASLHDMLLNNMGAVEKTSIPPSQWATSLRKERDARLGLGRHPGLAGRSSFNRPVGGGTGGGPGAGPNLRRGSGIDSSQQENENHMRPHIPSFNGPNRFPGGIEMMPEGQPPGADHQVSRYSQYSTGDVSARNSNRSDSYFGSNAANVSFIDKAEAQAVNNLLTRIRLQYKEFCAEFIACFILLLVGASVDAQVQLSAKLTQDQAGSYSSQNWAWGLAVMSTIHLAGGISGAHCNPGITIGLAVFRGFPWRMVWIYLLAQYLGCFCGAGLAYAIYQPAINLYEGQGVRTIVGPHATGGFFTTVPSTSSTSASAFGTEICASAILGGMVLAIGDDSNSPPGDGMSALILGLTVTMIGMSFGWNTGYPINPARDLGPRIFLSAAGYGNQVWTHNDWWWTYGGQAATYLGTLFGCFCYDLFLYHGRQSPLNTVIHWRWQRFRQTTFNAVSAYVKRNKKTSETNQSSNPKNLEEQIGKEYPQSQPTDASLTKDAITRGWAQEIRPNLEPKVE